MNGNPASHRLHLPEIVVVAVLIVITAVVFVPAQAYLEARMAELKQEVIDELEGRIGRSIRYESISPSILRAVEIRGLVIDGNADEPDRLLEIERLRLFYHPFQILFGGPNAAAADIRIEDTVFNVDHRRDGDIVSLIQRVVRGDGTGAGAGTRPTLEIAGENLEIRYQAPDAVFVVEDVAFETIVRPEEIELSWHSGVSVRTITQSDAGVPAPIDARISVAGVIRPDEEELDLRLSVPWARTSLFRLTNQSFDVSYDRDGIEVRKLRNNDPVDLTLKAGPELREITLSVLAEGFVPDGVVTFRGPMSPFNPWLLGEVSGSAELSYDRRTGEVFYSGNLEGRTNNPELPEQVSVSARVSGNSARAEVDELTVTPPEGSLSFEGSIDIPQLAPEGTIRLAGFSYAPVTAPVTGAMRVSRSGDGTLSATARRLAYGRSVLYDVEAEVSPSDLETAYRAVASFDAGGESRLTVSGRLRENGDLVADVHAGGVPADGVYELAGEIVNTPDADTSRLASVLIHGTASVRYTAGKLSFDAPYVSLRDTEDPSRYASLAARLTADELEVTRLHVGVGDRIVRGRFEAEVGNGRSVPFETNIEVDGRAYRVEGAYRPGQSLELRSEEGLTAQIYRSREGRFIFAARASDVPVPGATENTRVTLRAGGQFSGTEEWSAEIDELAVDEVAGPSSALTLALELGPGGGTVRRLAYRDEVSRLKGSGSITYGAGEPVRLGLRAESSDGEETYDAEIRYEDQDIYGGVEITGSPLRRLVAEPIRGGFNGSLELETLLTRPELTLQFETVEASFNTDSVSAAGTLRVTERSVVMNRVNIRYLTRTLSDARGTIDLESGDATFSASFENRERDEERRIKALVRATFAERAVPLELEDVGTAPFDAVVRLAGIEFPQGNEEPWELRVRRTAERISVDGGPQDSVRVRLASNGEFDVSFGEPLPLRFAARGMLDAGEIEANVTNVLVDLDRFGSDLGRGTVRLTGGRFTGALRVVGPVNDPDFFGTLEAEDARGAIDFIAEPLGPADTFIVFQEKIAEINRFEVPVGEGYGYLTGTLILNRWAPEEYRLRIEAPDEPGVHVAYNFGGLYVDGLGRGELKIQGTAGRADISGNILVDETSLTIGEAVEAAEKTSRRSVTTVDLSFETVGPTEFLWPNQDFPVLRALAERGEELDLSYASDTGSFSLSGRIDVQAGEIYYFDRSFYIREGRILFNEDEDEFDPRLAVRAEIREISSEGPVRVYLVVDEERLSSFTPRFESSPPLSDTELIALLGGNLLNREGQEDVDLSQAVLLTSDLVTQFGVINRFERSVRDALGLDLFSVRTQIFQNLVLGSLGQPQYPLDNTSPSLGQYLENTSVFLGKYLGSELFMELLFGLRSRGPFEPIPPGEGPIELEAEIGLEWQTPLFLLQWRFFPSNPETLFVTDNQIEFSWEFSY